MNPIRILATVADHFGIETYDLTGRCRTKAMARARHVAMCLVRDSTDLSYPEIGRLFGGRDHTTVIYACRKVESSPVLAVTMALLRSRLDQPAGADDRRFF
jgi:chromosomal replication initiator protein